MKQRSATCHYIHAATGGESYEFTAEFNTDDRHGLHLRSITFTVGEQEVTMFLAASRAGEHADMLQGLVDQLRSLASSAQKPAEVRA